jgi:hypothetical protein
MTEKRHFRIPVLVLPAFCTLPLWAAPNIAKAETYTVTAEQWARPRSGERVSRLPGLHGLEGELEANRNLSILIRYAGGDDGLLWAEELRGWLVALGISGERIHLRPGLDAGDRIVLETEKAGDPVP